MTNEEHLNIDSMTIMHGGATPSTAPPVLADLVRADERISFLYFERCVVNQAENSIAITDDEAQFEFP